LIDGLLEKMKDAITIEVKITDLPSGVQV